MQNTLSLQLVRISTEAIGIKSFELRSNDGRQLPPFSPGAHIDVHLPGGIVRQYSLCNSSRERDRYRIAVLLTPDTRGGSAAMHELREGQVLVTSEPRNHFPLASQDSSHPSLLLVGGVGITPILCMADKLHESGAMFKLHYAARSPQHMAFRESLSEGPLSASTELHFDDGPPPNCLDFGRLLGAQDPSTHLYVCGPAGFIEAAVGKAREIGWAEERIHFEYFAAAPRDHDADGDREFLVRIASTGEELVVGSHETVLAVLARHGIEVPASCEQGVCGTCATAVLGGECDHRDMVLDPAQRESNLIFHPCVSRARTPVLVLDL